MERKIIEISNNNYYLSINRGFLAIKNELNNEISNIVIDDILSVIISSNNAVISKNAINALIDNNCVVIFCDKYYMPSSITIPCSNHWQNGERVRKQISSSVPLQKKLCKKIIQRKILNQSLIIKWHKPKSTNIERLKRLSKSVKSGDTGNNEAIAARIYFKELFGKDFIRDRKSNDINALLNYAYTILRSCVARAVTGAGLLPALGVMHTNKLNPFTLVDDLIEPYRPLADSLVFNLIEEYQTISSLTPEIKKKLSNITSLCLDSETGQTTLPNSIFETANSLAKSYIEKGDLLKIGNYIERNSLL